MAFMDVVLRPGRDAKKTGSPQRTQRAQRKTKGGSEDNMVAAVGSKPVLCLLCVFCALCGESAFLILRVAEFPRGDAEHRRGERQRGPGRQVTVLLPPLRG